MKRLFVLFLLFLFASSCQRGPRVEWETYSTERFDEALGAGKPIIVDFYAAWCGPCMVMKETTFRDARVVEALAPFVRLKADMSFRESKKVLEIAARHRIRAYPTLILFNGKGEEVLRFGFARADDLLQLLQKNEAALDLVNTKLNYEKEMANGR